MARNYGRFTTTIWRDPDFTRLTRAQQAVYFMLCTQPEVTAAGTLPLTLRRWANSASDDSPATLRDELEALEDGGHIVIDEDTEELLIVKFIKFDQGWYNEKRWPLVAAALAATASVHIRDTAVDELVRLTLSGGVSDEACQRVQNWLSARAWDRESGSDRSGLSKSGTSPTPQSTLQEGEPSASSGPPSMFCSRHPNGTEKACGPCGTAKLRYAAWVKSTAGREAEARAERRRLIDECMRCNAQGIREDADTGKPLGRCDHRPLEAVSA